MTVRAQNIQVDVSKDSYNFAMTIRMSSLHPRKLSGNTRTVICKLFILREYIIFLGLLAFTNEYERTPANYVRLRNISIIY